MTEGESVKNMRFKLFRHLHTIGRHRRQVIRNCAKSGIFFQGLFHDVSKLSPTEFIPSVKYYQGNRSPNEREREIFGYSKAWMHHKGRNKHHFEYWVDINPQTKMYEPVPMPMRYLKEMFCDRVAASKIYQGENYTDAHPIEYFLKGKERRSIHPETSDLLEGWLSMLFEKGEEQTFCHIRSLYKRSKREKDFKY